MRIIAGRSFWRVQLPGMATTRASRASHHATSREVEAVEVHHLVPRSHEVTDELLLRVVTRVDFRDGAELRVRTEHEIDTRAGPLDLRPSRDRAPRTYRRRTASTPCVMSSRFTKKSLVNVSGRSVKTPCFDWPTLAFRTRMPPTSTVISGAVSVSSCARSTSNSSAGW